jgi:xanthine dehydrogenase accessory factor
MHDIMDVVDQWLGQGSVVALATVVETWGSSPRQAGAKMAITADMAMIGSVSGGCVETAVVQEAVDGLADKRPRLLHYGVSDDTAWQVGLACGGKMSVYVEPLDRDWWQVVTQSVRQNHAAATITVIEGPSAGQKILFDAADGITYTSPNISPELTDSFAHAAQAAIERRKGERTHIADLDVQIDVHRPQPRLIIIGGAHVALSLQRYAKELGFIVALVDPREVFATPERFPEIETILHSYPDKALPQLGLDSETYVAVLSHDPKIDDPALRTALPSAAPYVGVLSSKRSHEQRVKRLIEAGVSPELLARIRTPIGLDIGAKTPEEIALSIMAEIVAVRNGVKAPAKDAVKQPAT